MKKIFLFLFMFVLMISLVGCGAKEKVAEKAAEKILQDAGVEADIDGDKVVIKGEDGQELTIGAGKWPTSDLAKNIPEFKGGKIISVMEADDSLFIMIEDISGEYFTAYLDEIKKIFTEEAFKMDTETGMMYAAENSKGLSVTLTYEKDAGLSIAVSQAELEED